MHRLGFQHGELPAGVRGMRGGVRGGEDRTDRTQRALRLRYQLECCVRPTIGSCRLLKMCMNIRHFPAAPPLLYVVNSSLSSLLLVVAMLMRTCIIAGLPGLIGQNHEDYV
jgi:hypothetical protein